jgi:hypothetical protein
MDEYQKSMQNQDDAESDNPEPPERQGEQTPEEEIEEPIEWDGSEAELVADDAAEYEEQQTGIKLSYILRQKEILESLKKSGFCKTTGTRAVAESVILAILAVAFAVTYILQKDTNSLVFGIISLLLIAVIWIVPQQGLKRRAKELTDGKEIHMEIYPDSIVMGENEGRWEIPLDGTVECEQDSNLLLIYFESRMVILPLRCVEPSVLPEVQAMIVSGTQPKI